MRVANTRRSLLETLIELIGIKSGLLLSLDELMRFLEQTYEKVDEVSAVLGGPSKWWQEDLDELVAVRAEELEANFILAMYSIGAIPDQRTSDQVLFDESTAKTRG